MQVKGSLKAACLRDDTAAASSPARSGGALRRDGFGFCTTRPLVGAQPGRVMLLSARMLSTYRPTTENNANVSNTTNELSPLHVYPILKTTPNLTTGHLIDLRLNRHLKRHGRASKA